MNVLAAHPPKNRVSHLLGPAPGDLTLRIRGTERDGQIVRLRAAKCTVGASPQCTLRLLAPGVGPLHCLIVRGAAGSVVRKWSPDTRLNGATFTDAPLFPGDRLGIGPLELEVLENLADGLPDQLEPLAAGLVPSCYRDGQSPAAIRWALQQARLQLSDSRRSARGRMRRLLKRLRAASEQVDAMRCELAEQSSQAEQLAARAELLQRQVAEHRQHSETATQQAAAARDEAARLAHELQALQQLLDQTHQQYQRDRGRWQLRCRQVADILRLETEAGPMRLDTPDADIPLPDEAAAGATHVPGQRVVEAAPAWPGSGQTSRLETQLAQLGSDLEHRLQQLVDREQRLARQHVELDAARAQVIQDQEALETVRTQLAQQRDALEAERTQLGQQRVELETDRAHLQQRQTEMEATWARVVQEQAELEESRLQLNQQHDESRQQVQNDRAQLARRVARLRFRHLQWRKHCAQTQRDLQLRRQRLEQEATRLRDAWEELQRQRDQWQDAEQRGQDQEEERRRLETLLCQLQEDCQRQQALAQAARQQLEQQAQQWQEDRGRLQAQIDHARAALRAERKARSEGEQRHEIELAERAQKLHEQLRQLDADQHSLREERRLWETQQSAQAELAGRCAQLSLELEAAVTETARLQQQLEQREAAWEARCRLAESPQGPSPSGAEAGDSLTADEPALTPAAGPAPATANWYHVQLPALNEIGTLTNAGQTLSSGGQQPEEQFSSHPVRSVAPVDASSVLALHGYAAVLPATRPAVSSNDQNGTADAGPPPPAGLLPDKHAPALPVDRPENADDEHQQSMHNYLIQLLRRSSGHEAEPDDACPQGGAAVDGRLSDVALQRRPNLGMAACTGVGWTSSWPAADRRSVPRTAPERSSNLTAMRELANQSARTAIDSHVERRWGQTVLGNLFVTVAALVTGLTLWYWSARITGVVGFAICSALTISCFWAVQTLLTLRLMFKARRQRATTEPVMAATPPSPSEMSAEAPPATDDPGSTSETPMGEVVDEQPSAG